MMTTKRLVNVITREDGIVLFEFFSMDKPAADQFTRIVEAAHGNVPPKLRVIYDFSKSPPPTMYFLRIQAELYGAYPHPGDEKSAYVAGPWSNAVWIRIIRGHLVSKDVMKIFKTRDEAVAWLLED